MSEQLKIINNKSYEDIIVFFGFNKKEIFTEKKLLLGIDGNHTAAHKFNGEGLDREERTGFIL